MPKAATEKKPKAAAKGKAEKPAKKERKKKDPNAPKKPLSAYMFFCSEERDKIKKENPEMKVTEVTSELGRRWKELEDGDKKKYYDLAEKDKERYEKDNANYKPSDDDKPAKKAAPKKKAPAKKKKDDSDDEEEPESESEGADEEDEGDDEDDE